jgi:deazaflavin-dependent oxidoreductase (nitroreductase family)
MASQSAPRRWQRILQVIPASRPGAWVFSNGLHHIDRLLFRLSNGRLSVPGLLNGLPVVMLRVVGAKSGQPRIVPLVGIRDGDKVVLIGTNFGQPRQPAWSHNLRAHPQVALIRLGGEQPYIAREASLEERERYWKKGDEIYKGYSAYRQRVRGREIPIMVLTPVVLTPKPDRAQS